MQSDSAHTKRVDDNWNTAHSTLCFPCGHRHRLFAMAIFAVVAPVIAAAFLASLVEAVEALTIVVAVSVVRGPRPALVGALAAMSLLVLLVALFGPLIERVPVRGLQVVVGILLLLFGLGWLRKAILRAGGALPLHDEGQAFAAAKRQYQGASADKAADWIGGLAAFKAVLLEGTEVVFIVLAVAVRPGMLAPAAAGAASACALVTILGLAVRAPLARIPENSLKFAVGSMLSGFGLFWTAEGMRAPFPFGDLAIPELIGLFLLSGLALAVQIRGQISRAPAWM